MNTDKLAQKINRSIAKFPRWLGREVHKKLNEILLDEKLVYYKSGGRPRTIDVMIRPWLATREQVRYYHEVSLILRNALSKIYSLYYHLPEARDILPITDEEKSWFFQINKLGLQRNQTIVDRLDSNATFSGNDWQANFKFIEQNSVGIGGLHYIPAAGATIERLIMPLIRRWVGPYEVSAQADTRVILYDVIKSHAKRIRAKRLNVGLIQDTQEQEGTEEIGPICEYLRKRGVNAYITDPRSICLRKGEVYSGSTPIDIFYRDSEIDEINEITTGKANVNAIKEAFIQNKIISSIAGEFDHKSVWEILSRPDYQKYFSGQQQAVFKRHIAWTRLIYPRATEDRFGRRIDLSSYIGKNKDSLVIKPNRLYGGEGVVLGRFVGRQTWADEINRAVKKPMSAVVQEYVDIKAEEFPIIDKNGNTSIEKRFVVSGFAATEKHIAFLIRYSVERIVNVSRKGGIVGVFMIRG